MGNPKKTLSNRYAYSEIVFIFKSQGDIRFNLRRGFNTIFKYRLFQPERHWLKSA
ncbi:hypothetical protein Pat9b_4879 (plasmid) [Pantoea sp. At-9b]|nr:hypothetical protein Pat9b_4879 [Pantoea sp. At-9b]